MCDPKIILMVAKIVEDFYVRKKSKFMKSFSERLTFVNDELLIADPYADKLLDPWNDQYISDETYPDLIGYPKDTTSGIVSVLQTADEEYMWQVTDFQPPAKTDLIIYELLIRDFTSDHSYRTLTDTISYLKNLGVNAIELMPVNEFEGNESWGYNPSFYFAPDKYYGPKNDLKIFIDFRTISSFQEI